MRLSVEDSPHAAEETQPRRHRSFLGLLFHGAGWLMATPFAWSGANRIKRGWWLIGDLSELLRARAARDKRVKTAGKSVFDLQATALSYGISVHQLEVRLAARRLQTARMAYAALVLGALFLAGWIWHALFLPWTATRVTSALYFVPFCAVFVLVAFYNALLNFQIRSGRLATWREYLETPDGFWPN
jgi:hypothetical protein